MFKFQLRSVMVAMSCALLCTQQTNSSRAQEKTDLPQYLAHSHAHNDYEHPHPLVDALSLGFASIEADVWLVDGELCVAHDRAKVDPTRRLNNLYLDPLLDRYRQNQGMIFANGETLILLVDIKSDGAATYPVLKKILTQYRPILEAAPGQSQPAVKVIVSGNRAIELILADQERLVGIDGRLKDLQTEVDRKLMPLISDNWRLHFRFLGEGEMSAEERSKLRDYVERVHRSGAQLRFWATPESEKLWHLLREEKVDFIGTDRLLQLSDYLK